MSPSGLASPLSAPRLSAKILVKGNGLEGKIEILKGKVGEVKVDEKVDIIVSEPLGFLLVHERMLESYVIARDRFLKVSGGGKAGEKRWEERRDERILHSSKLTTLSALVRPPLALARRSYVPNHRGHNPRPL